MTINTSEQLKEAPEPAARNLDEQTEAPDNYQRILHTFRATTEALIRRAELPEHSRDVVLRMMGEFYQAPDAGSLARQVFRNFRDATEALLECEKLPEGVHTAITRMVDEFANECGGNAAIEDSYARKVISRVFGLDDEDEEEAQSLTPAQAPASASGHHKEIRAERFTLVDDGGNERARLRIAGGGAVLTMMDPQGRPRLRLRADDKEATITICGERGEAGKGVLPATDEVERVTIGYESAAQEPRILIKDGNENECVSVQISNVEPSDGFIRLRNPADGSHTLVSSDGLIALDGKREPLPEYRGRQAAAAATEPTTTPNADRKPRLAGPTDEAVRELVRRIIPCDDDDAAQAFIVLIDSIAYNDDRHSRDNIALRACAAAYQMTMAYHDVAGKFFDAATEEFRLRAS